jgi:hypothetical protein
MKVLICGDSYCITDPDYAELHWSEKMLAQSADIEICNLAHGGCSNAMILLQLLQGIKTQPQFVILSFTTHGRYELDKDTTAFPQNFSIEEIANYQKKRYTTNNYDIDKKQLEMVNQWQLLASSENFEKLKNYFYISFCLMYLKTNNIPFCYSLGGFEFKQDYTTLINSNYVENLLVEYRTNELATNLWYHGSKPRPFFHVDNDQVHTLFANECMEFIEKNILLTQSNQN